MIKIESNKFINIRKIVKYLGTEIPIKFPHIHAATGHDTTSFLHVVGKVKVSQWKRKVVFHGKFQTVKKFIQTVYYPGKEEENLTEIRVLLCKQMKITERSHILKQTSVTLCDLFVTKIKTSQSLPLKEKWMLQAIKGINYQIFYSSRVDESIISDILLQDNGWIVDNENKEVRP